MVKLRLYGYIVEFKIVFLICVKEALCYIYKTGILHLSSKTFGDCWALYQGASNKSNLLFDLLLN